MKYCQFKGLNHSSFLSLITWVTWSLTEEYFCKALLPSKSTPPTFTKSKNSFTVVCCGCFLVINERQRKIYDYTKILLIHFTDFTMKITFWDCLQGSGLKPGFYSYNQFLILMKSAVCSFANFVLSKLQKLRIGRLQWVCINTRSFFWLGKLSRDFILM